MSAHRPQPIGVVLAGGLGRRLGGSKAGVLLHGAPLISYPLDALRQALARVVVVAKADSQLPRLPSGVEVWVEAGLPRHPLTGLVHALRRADGSPIVVCACDLPLVTAEIVRELAAFDAAGAPAVVAGSEGWLQPLLGCYGPGALRPLARALQQEGVRLQAAVGGLEPRILDVGDPSLLLNVNTPEDLLRAGALLAREAGPPGDAPINRT